MSYSDFAPKTGDIVRVNLPSFERPGQPGEINRLALVLGVEFDEVAASVEGVYLCRLSERVSKVRRWDCFIDPRDIRSNDSATGEGLVLRTPRIDLIPAEPAYFGASPSVIGQVNPAIFDRISRKLEDGQNSSFNEESLGPRGPLDNAVVVHDTANPRPMAIFDYDALLSAAAEDAERHAATKSRFQYEFTMACSQRSAQMAVERRRIHQEIFAGNPDAPARRAL